MASTAVSATREEPSSHVLRDESKREAELKIAKREVF
jgi:hypothetical protein